MLIETQLGSRNKLLDAALYVIRSKGYSAARVEDICEAAHLTKGSFFHHFPSKEDLALAAAEHFAAFAESVFATAPYRALADPLDRLLGYVNFRKAILQGELPEYTCLLGTMVQETYETHPAIRKVCERCIGAHAATLVNDIEAAVHKHGISADWTVESLAYYTQSVIQGAFILAKAQQNAQVAAECLDHLHRYLKLLFACPNLDSDRFPTSILNPPRIGETVMTTTIHLTHEPETIDFPAAHYVYVERVGNIPTNAPQAWKTVEKFAAVLMPHNKITGAAALYKPNEGIYRAGFMLAAPPVNLPEGLSYARIAGGRYARFTLNGPFTQLPEATSRAFGIVAEKKIALRDDFNIEHYLTDPATTPAEKNVTQILFPAA